MKNFFSLVLPQVWKIFQSIVFAKGTIFAQEIWEAFDWLSREVRALDCLAVAKLETQIDCEKFSLSGYLFLT